MNRIESIPATVAALLLWLAIGASPALAAKDIVIDWDSGEVTVTEDPVDEEAEKKATESYLEESRSAQEQIERLKKAVALQQRVIRQQRAAIKALRQENRRLERLLLGYDQILRRRH